MNGFNGLFKLPLASAYIFEENTEKSSYWLSDKELKLVNLFNEEL